MAGRKGAKVGGASLVTQNEHVAEELASLRYAITLMRKYGLDTEHHLHCLERLHARLRGRLNMPRPQDTPPNAVERREPADPMQSIMHAMVRVGRETTE